MFTVLPHISRITLATAIGCICGVGVRSFFAVPYDVALFLIVVSLAGWVCIFYKKQKGWLVVVFFLGVVGGITIMHDRLSLLAQYENMVGQQLMGEAVIERDIVQKQWYAQVYARYVDYDFTVLMQDEKYPRVTQGDHIMLTCTLTLPEKNDDFDYRMYLAMHHVFFICEDHTYEIEGREETLSARLMALRGTWEQIVDRIIPSPQAGLANGLLFGGDDRLSEELQVQFARTGMTHVVAVSGYNVSIIIAVMIGVAISCGAHRKLAVVIAIGGVVAFIALIGFPSSGVRAAIMGIIVLVAAIFGRVSHAYSAVCFSAALMIVHNPLILRYDVGFQLSFLATIGILVTHTFFQNTFVMRKKSFGFLEIIILTASAQVFVVPIILYHFHTFATLSIIANILVLPIIPLTMLMVFLLIVFSYIFLPLSVLCGWIAYALLSYEIAIVQFFATVPWSSIDVMHVQSWWIVTYYVILFSFVYYFHKKYEAKKSCDL